MAADGPAAGDTARCAPTGGTCREASTAPRRRQAEAGSRKDVTWDCEVWPNSVTDRDGLDGNLWRDVAALQHYGVAAGYTAADCASRGKAAPCFGPADPVTYAETIVFITRAMVRKGYRARQPSAPQPYAGVPAVFAAEFDTFRHYTQSAGGVQAPPANWNAQATRGRFAHQLWVPLNSYWGTDDTLPDGRPAGGYAP